MLKKLRESVKNNLVNLPGWRTDRKIIVIESDDWGSIRMASKDAYNRFLKKGYPVDQCAFNRYDAIESNQDLELLFGVLNSVQDVHGNPAVITANNNVANPDFEKIRASNFKEYFYEPFTKTLTRYPDRDRVMELYQQGIEQKLIYPQFHGREHINVNRWMFALNSGCKVQHDAFEQKMFAVHTSGDMNCRRDHLDAFGMRYRDEWVSMEEVIQTGLDLFEEIWGFRAKSFIAPCYIWPVEIEKLLAQNGIKYIQGTHVQRIPGVGVDSKIKRKYHYQGQANKWKQRYLVRNVNFEPSLNSKEGSVAKAMDEIENAFKHSTPAIISSHRLNYIGSIHPQNRECNLKLLQSLLKKIREKWPDIEFKTTCQLGQCFEKDTIISNKKRN